MGGSNEGDRQTREGSEPLAEGRDWARFIGCFTAAEALEELAGWLGPGTQELVLEAGSSAGECIASWHAASNGQDSPSAARAT